MVTRRLLAYIADYSLLGFLTFIVMFLCMTKLNLDVGQEGWFFPVYYILCPIVLFDYCLQYHDYVYILAIMTFLEIIYLTFINLGHLGSHGTVGLESFFKKSDPATRLRIVAKDGSKLPLHRRFLRVLIKILSRYLILPIFVVFFNKQERAFHDIIANSKVI
jgi:uncharacterized RDD family membrane protein YckC